MADTAFDPNLFYRPLDPNAAEPPSAPPAAAPPPPPAPDQVGVQTGAPPAPPPPPTGQGDQTTGVPPDAPPPSQAAPSAPQQPPTFVPPSDNDDMQQQQAADQEDQQTYNGNLRSHHGNYDILKDTVRPDDHPDASKYKRALELYAGMDKQTRARWKPMIDQMKAKITNDTKAQNSVVKDKLKVEAAHADAPYENTTARLRTGETISGLIDTVTGDYAERAKDRDPKIAQQADFTIKTSPLTTMAIKKRDGTMSYEPLRDTATALVTLNPRLAPDVAIRTVLSLASPVGFDDSGKPVAGVNGKTGAGAKNYQVIGRDVRDNYLIVTRDGQHLRVDPDTMASINQTRTIGYHAAKQWHIDQAKQANEPDWLTRAYRAVIPGKGF